MWQTCFLKELIWPEIEMQTDEHGTLQADLETNPPAGYLNVLEGEAIRLNCAVFEVRSRCPVLPLAEDEAEHPRLADLPDSILLKIIHRLDTLDVFRFTLVCKRWKRLIYDNPWNLIRAEHARTTHLITFTDWMDRARVPCWNTFDKRYCRFSVSLIEWCCGIANNLETVILSNDLSFSTVKTVLQSCPRLKNLQIGYRNYTKYLAVDEPAWTELVIPDLEFYCSYLQSEHMASLNTEILVSCESLRCFGGQLDISQALQLDTGNLMKHAFENLIALDLTNYSVHVLEILADTENLQLRYFRVGSITTFSSEDEEENERARELLGRVVGKLKRLETFVATEPPGITHSVISRMTEAKLKLKHAIFVECFDYLEQDAPEDWTLEVLAEFGQMLLSNDPDLDLAQFYLVVEEEHLLQEFRERNIGFTLLSEDDFYWTGCYDFTLSDLSIKRRLGMDF